MSELFAPAAISVSELNAAAKDLLENAFAGIWVAGEVSNLTRAASGHYYFSLKDAAAQVRCVLFKFAAARLSAPLQEGSRIEVSGRISLYEARGEFQITVNEVRQTGLGQLFERYERLKAQLQAEGLFDPARKKPLPAPETVQTVGIITSLAAAALRDMVITLCRRAPQIKVIVYPAAVQGQGSKEQLSAALALAGSRRDADVLIIGRGGGSIEDLWSFNEETVVRAIAACPLPTVSAVGHETDFTLADFAADVRAATPTAAAELVSPKRADMLAALAHTQNTLRRALQQHYGNAAQKLDFLAQRLVHPRHRLHDRQTALHRQAQQLAYAVRQQLNAKHAQADRLAQQTARLRPDPAQARHTLQQLDTGLRRAAADALNRRRERLAAQAQLLEAVSPQQIMRRGFAVATTARGQVVHSAGSLKTGQKLHLYFADGRTDVQVLPEQRQEALFD